MVQTFENVTMDNVLTESTVASADDKVLSGHMVAQTSVTEEILGQFSQ